MHAINKMITSQRAGHNWLETLKQVHECMMHLHAHMDKEFCHRITSNAFNMAEDGPSCPTRSGPISTNSRMPAGDAETAGTGAAEEAAFEDSTATSWEPREA